MLSYESLSFRCFIKARDLVRRQPDHNLIRLQVADRAPEGRHAFDQKMCKRVEQH